MPTKDETSNNLLPVDPLDEIHTLLTDSLYTADELDDFSRMHDSLTTDFLQKHMLLIENELREALPENLRHTTDYESLKVILKEHGKHLLTNTMLKWGHDNGFNQPNQEAAFLRKDANGNLERVWLEIPATLPVIIGFVEPGVFGSFILGSPLLTKDIGAGVSHGEFSHYLQQRALVDEYKKNPQLSKTPLEMIKLLGASLFKKDGDKTLPYQKVLDYDPKSEKFNNPDFLNANIVGSIERSTMFLLASERLNPEAFPILHTLIKGRADKRNPSYKNDPDAYTELLFIKPHTQRKYQNKAGWLVDNAIFFPIPNATSSTKLTYDHVKEDISFYKSRTKEIYKIPDLDEKSSNLDQLINLYSDNSIIALLKLNNLDDIVDFASTALKCGVIFTQLTKIQNKMIESNQTLSMRDIFNTVITATIVEKDTDAKPSFKETITNDIMQSITIAALTILEKLDHEQELAYKAKQHKRKEVDVTPAEVIDTLEPANKAKKQKMDHEEDIAPQSAVDSPPTNKP